jgi:PAS domain S-box-containing protein
LSNTFTTSEKSISDLQNEIEELKIKLEEARGIIEAIKDGSVDALILNREGKHSIYSIESADYTYRVLIEKFGEGAVSISQSGLILYCNDYFARLIGTSADRIVGTYFHSFVDSVGQFQDLKNALDSGSSKGEITLNADGRKLSVYVSLTDLHPLVPAIAIIVTDLTEKRKHEEDLAMYQRKLEIKINELNETNAHLVQFIHVISHDIKEPLRKIVSYSTHLRNTKPDLFKKGELNNLSVISNSALRLNSLVDDLAKYSLNISKTELAAVDLNRILAEVITDLEIIIRENGVTFRLDQLPVIIASEFQVRQLFLNLISNSIKYRKKDVSPLIRITTEVKDCIDLNNPNKKFHKIAVADNGIGIDKNHLDKIFVIFQRLHPQGEYEGNGVGLAICKKIMENHRGKIDVESMPEIGSNFNVYFPLNK